MTGVPPGGSRRLWWQRCRRLNSPRPFLQPATSPRRRGSSGRPRKQVARPGNPAQSPLVRPGPEKPDGAAESGSRRRPRPSPGLVTPSESRVRPSAASPIRGLAPRGLRLPFEVSGLGPSLHLRRAAWRAAAAPRPSSLSEGNINWSGRSAPAPSGTFTWRSTSPTARKWQ